MNRIVALSVAALGLFWLASCIVFVDETQYGYVTRFGKPLPGGVLAPGLKIKFPWPIDRVRRFDRRLQVYEPPALERITNDKKSLTVGSYICWRIADVERFFGAVGTPADAQQRLDVKVTDELSAAIGARTLSQLVSDRPGESEIESMMDEITVRLRAMARAEFGIEVVDVRLKRFNHPADVRQAIYDRIRSERNRDAVRYRSEGDSKGQEIRSLADRDREFLLAEADAQATELRGKADAEKTDILNAAHAKDPAFYELLRTLEAYRTLLDDKTTLVLSTNNAIFRLLTEKSDRLSRPNATETAGKPDADRADRSAKPTSKVETPKSDADPISVDQPQREP